MKKTLVFLAIAAAALFLAANISLAYGPKGGGCPFSQGQAPAQAPCLTKADGTQPSAEELEKWQAERDAYFKDTEGLRSSIQEKYEALGKVMDAEEVDADQAKALQNEISGLKAELAQKRIDHQLRVKELGFTPGGGRSQGAGCVRGAGYGPGCGGQGAGYGAGNGAGNGQGRGGCGRW